MNIDVNVINQQLSVPMNLKKLYTGTQEFIKFVFHLPKDWDELSVVAQFGQNGTAYNQYLDGDNSAYLPAEIGAGTCTLMLYGTKRTTIATTNYLTLTITQDIFVENAQSTEISESLYTQLVNRFDELQGEYDDLRGILTDFINSDEVTGLITQSVEDEMAEYLASGKLAELTILDGTIERVKVDGAFETTLQKADSAMQPSVYDTHSHQTDIFDYVDGKTDTIQTSVGSLNTAVNDIKTEIRGTYSIDGQTYLNLGAAVRGVLTQAKAYTDTELAAYEPYSIEIVNQLPPYGEDRTFYLVPNASGAGYDKYWWVTNDDEAQWDVFGGSSTLVVSELPDTGDESIDYILHNNDGNLFYKYIDDAWEMIGGSLVEIVDTLPDTGNEFTDYYLSTEDGYVHYRYIDGEFEMIGGAGGPGGDLTDYYTKDEIDSKVTAINSSISNQGQDIEELDAKIDSIGNLVSDVTETNTGVQIHYRDGTSKNVTTKDTSVTVEDVNSTSTGIQIVYTDASTKDIEISGGGGGSTSGSAIITRITSASVTTVFGEEFPIEYSFRATDSAGDVVGAGSAIWYVNNVRKATSTAYQGENSFDIAPYLSVGTNSVKLSISVDTGGESATVTTKTWSINAVNLYLTWDYDDTTLNTADTTTIRWIPYGDVSKTTHFVIDGTERTDLQSTTTRSGVQQYVTIDKLSHGSHKVEIYLTADVGITSITSESVVHDMMFVDAESDVPIISCSLNQFKVVQYNTLQIPVAIYNPSSLTANAVLAVDGTEVATWINVDRTLHYWNYTPSDYGSKVLTITSGSTVKTLNITVTKLDIDNEEVTGYQFRLKASDIAGNDNLREWSSNGVTASFSQNFDWNNGGIQTETDEKGFARQYVCIKAGTTMTINYNLFANDAKVNGKNFKIIFKTANCRDYDAVWLDCISDGIGIRLGANSGMASSEQNTVSIQYREGSYIEFEYDIYPDSTVSATGFPMRYIQTYIDGVLSSTNIYAANDNFMQTNQKSIVIGSEDCDVYLYLVKVYETQITLDNHMENFIADAPNATEMVERYNRNDILSQNGEISYLKLAEQNPKCRVHLWNIPRMTQNKIKKDPVAGCSYQQIYLAGDEGDQITAENVTIGVQGTSSINYISSAANTDGRFESGFTDGNGNHLDGYSMSENSIPVNYFNTKVNVASCENINNMCIAEWYDQHQPYLCASRANVENGRDCMEHHIGVQFIRDRHEDNEPASAALFTDIDPNGENYHMYAICNMGNSKDNSTVFHNVNNPLECCVETKDNNSAICMMTAQLTEEDLDSKDYFEFRYPSKPSAQIKTAFINFVNWMCSMNPAAATGDALDEPVTYGPYTFKGTSEWDTVEQPNEVLAGLTISDYAGTYTHDTYEYRMARLLDECEDHLVMDSIVYHYVFVEQHAMVDNVTKNTFWGTDDLIHWHLCKNYDNDKQLVVIKPFLIYGENPEMGNASEILCDYLSTMHVHSFLFGNTVLV